MTVSRLTTGWRLATLALATLAVAFAGSLTAPAAKANDLPFWERADAAAKAQKPAKVSYAKKSKTKSKSVAYTPSKKKTYVASKKPAKKLGGYAAATEPVKKKAKGVKVAALGDSYYPSEAKPKKSLSGGGVSWVASAGCLDGSLKAVVYQVASNYGPVTVNSTCRSKGHNASVGGAPKSKHLSGDAVDFRVHGNVGAVYAYLKSNGSVGGLKHYGGGLFHIDNGDRRSW